MNSQSNGPPGGSPNRGYTNDNEEKKSDSIDALFSENWKQKAMIRPESNKKFLTGLMLTLEVVATYYLISAASSNVGVSLQESNSFFSLP